MTYTKVKPPDPDFLFRACEFLGHKELYIKSEGRFYHFELVCVNLTETEVINAYCNTESLNISEFIIKKCMNNSACIVFDDMNDVIPFERLGLAIDKIEIPKGVVEDTRINFKVVEL